MAEKKKATKKKAADKKEPKKMGRPMKFETVEELQDAIDRYFKSCYDYKRDMYGNRIVDKEPMLDADGEQMETEDGRKRWVHGDYVMELVKPFTVTGLASFLDTTRETLMDYETKYGDDFSDTIKKAKMKIYAFTEESLFRGKATGPIFSLKNNYDWVDRKEVDGTMGINVIDITIGDEEYEGE